jgi:hypothetical protein
MDHSITMTRVTYVVLAVLVIGLTVDGNYNEHNYSVGYHHKVQLKNPNNTGDAVAYENSEYHSHYTQILGRRIRRGFKGSDNTKYQDGSEEHDASLNEESPGECNNSRERR